ncbi:MAG: helix-turn-helix domain-containing protein [Verrucomicrobia bacterium]|nr:helix-turn-helix domain-containing protein [Verrucomicrobiota bacterium]MCH8526021.1 helix-turn-helix domain-containing protein [Kiritimatiellia bacterium]
MSSASENFKRLGSGYLAGYGHRGVLMEQAVVGMLETARGERSDWMVRPIFDLKGLSDPSIRGLAAVLWPFGNSTAFSYPVLNLSNSVGRRAGVGNFLSDDAAIGRMAVEFFQKKGVTQLLVLGISGRAVHEERYAAAVEHGERLGMKVTGFAHDFNVFDVDVTGFADYTDALCELMRPVFRTLPLGAGVFCSNDWLAQQILFLMQRHFPGHLDSSPVLGVDNDAEQNIYFGTQLPGLSSIVPAFREMGAAAFRWLAEHPGDKGVERMAEVYRRFPPVALIERGSTAAGGCADPMTARMIRWAWERVQRGEKVSVSDMARAHRMHVKSVERRFQEHTGGNAVDLLVRLKLNLAKSMLRETDLPISEISLRCGYSKQDILSRALRAAEGCTPREYRMRKRGAG